MPKKLQVEDPCWGYLGKLGKKATIKKDKVLFMQDLYSTKKHHSYQLFPSNRLSFSLEPDAFHAKFLYIDLM